MFFSFIDSNIFFFKSRKIIIANKGPKLKKEEIKTLKILKFQNRFE